MHPSNADTQIIHHLITTKQNAISQQTSRKWEQYLKLTVVALKAFPVA